MDLLDFLDRLQFLENVKLLGQKRKRRHTRVRNNRMSNYTDEEFITRFRLSKESVLYLIPLIERKLRRSKRRNSITPLEQVLIALRFYACGSFYVTIGDFCGVHKSTACRVVQQVTVAICSLRKKFVYLPRNAEEIKQQQLGFMGIARFPKVVSAIGCMHVRIISPGTKNAESFRNSKGHFSLIAQLMCSHDMRIQNVVTRWPGGTEVNHIFNSSQAKNRFESGEFNDGLILGGSNYRLSNKLLTPITKPVSLTDELYNAAHIHTQNVVERCVRLLQSRFPLLMRCLRCDIKLTQRIIVAATILHNIAIENGDDEPTTDISKKQLDESSDESSSSKFLHDSHNESSEVKNKEKDVYRTRNEIIKYFDDLSQKQIDR